MTPRAGIVGLGIMGSAYARHLIEAGFATWGYDIDAEASARFAARGGIPALNPCSLAEACDVVITALPNLGALEAAYFSTDGLAAGAHAGLVIAEQSTFPLDAKEYVRAVLAARGVAVLDAPVSGNGAQAQRRDVVVFASGDIAAYERAMPVMAAYARDVRYTGAFGTGSKLKFIANLLVTIHNLATAEAVVLSEKAGIDPLMMLDCLRESAASSRMLELRGAAMAAQKYQPASTKLELYEKDIRIIEEFARSSGAPVPLFAASATFYTAALANGHAADDTAAIVSVLRAMAALPVRP